jgi:VanZ family protein
MTRKRPWWTWLFFVQVAVVVGAGALASLGRVPVAVFTAGVDKLGHFLGLGVLALLAVGFFGRARARPTLLVIAALSVLEEVSQGLLPARTFDFGDMAANLAGIALGGGLGVALTRVASRTSAAQSFERL